MYTQVRNLDIVYTASCNMKCSYCFIHKNPDSMLKNNGAIRQALVDGSFAQAIIKQMADSKNDLIQLALWGGEPTLNQDLFEDFITPLLDFFPNVIEVHFSTNGSQSVLGFAEAIYKYTQTHPDRLLWLNVQFSIDGPPQINDTNRAENATRDTWNTLKELIIYGNEHCNKFFHIHTAPKATMNSKQYFDLAQGNNLFAWYKFFDEWQDSVVKLNTSDYAHHDWLAQPSFSQPSDWTLTECKNYAILIKKLREIDDTQFKFYRHPLLTRVMEPYLMWMGNEIHQYPLGQIGCSGGISNYSIDYQGKLMTCHHVYDNVVMGDGAKKKFYKYTVADSEDENALLFLNGYLYHDNIEFRKQQVFNLVTLMVYAGEIDKKYMEPIWFERLFLFSQFEARCWCGEMADITSNIYLSDIGSIRLYCYGALEELVAYYEQYKNRYQEYQSRRKLLRPE